MKQVTNLNDSRQYYASDALLEELKEKMKPLDLVYTFSYTDYGGDFMDKVFIAYFSEKFPESIVKENTSYFGENAFLFGEVAAEFIEASENYPLGFRDIEEYYLLKQSEQETEDFQRFLADIEKYHDYKVSPDALDYLTEHKGGYYNITTQGVDYSERDLIKFCEAAGIISKVIEQD